MDDRTVFLDNSAITIPGGWAMIWGGISVFDYLPVTYSLFRLCYGIWGSSAQAFHTLDLTLHLVGSLMLVATLKRIGVRGAWWGASLFALHPVNAASAGWIAEIKNTLSLPLALGAIMTFFSRRRMVSSFLAPALFALSLLSKASVVGLPLCLALISQWRGERIDGRMLRKLLPWVILSLISGLVAVYFQFTKAMGEGSEAPVTPISMAIVRALWAVGFDLRQIIWPDNLSFLYGNRGPLDGSVGPWMLLAVAVALTILAWNHKSRSAAARAWLLSFGCFLSLVVPVLGLVPMEYLKMAPVADHWLYLPMIPLTALAGSVVFGSLLVPRTIIASCALAVLGFLSHQRYETMATPLSFWKSVLATDPHSPAALRNLSVQYCQTGLFREAIDFARRDVADHPESLSARLNLCGVLGNSGKTDEALELCREINLSWNSSEAWSMRGDLLRKIGHSTEALEAYRTALSLSPRMPRALIGIGRVGYDLDSPEIMLPPLEELVSFQRGNIEAMILLGAAYAGTGQAAKARKIWQQALLISPLDQNLIQNLTHLKSSGLFIPE